MVTVHEGIDVDRIAHLEAANVHAEFFLPHGAPLIGNIAALVPQLGTMGPVEGQAAAYLCADFVCRAPVTTAAALRALLQG